MTNYSRNTLQTGRRTYGVPSQQYGRRNTALAVAAPRLPIKFKPLLIAAVLLVLGIVVINGMHNHAAASRLAADQQRQQAAAAHQQAISHALNQVNAIAADYPLVNFSIDVQTLNSTNVADQQHVGNDDAQDAGSVGKLITATTWLNAIEKGDESNTAKLGGQTSSSLLKAMIVNSDDQAWQLLNDQLTHPVLQNFATSHGLTDYDADDNLLSSSSINKLLAQLWSGKLANKADTQLLLNYMRQANYRDYLVAGAPAGTTVYHKVGIDGDHVNDAAIITKGGKAMSLVVMTDGNGTYNWPQRAEAIQQITTALATAYL